MKTEARHFHWADVGRSLLPLVLISITIAVAGVIVMLGSDVDASDRANTCRRRIRVGVTATEATRACSDLGVRALECPPGDCRELVLTFDRAFSSVELPLALDGDGRVSTIGEPRVWD